MSHGSPLAPALLLLLSVGGDASLEPSVLLHFVLAEICLGDVIAAVSAAPSKLLLLSSASNQRSVCGRALSTLLLLPHGQ